MPIISVIVPVYNVEKYINNCIMSIQNQTFTDFECILVDDGSPDTSPNICKYYAQKDNRFRVIHQENQGLSAARNTGLAHSNGKLICFIDSDDYIHPDYLNLLYSAAYTYDADVVCCGYKIIHENDELPKSWEAQTLSFNGINSGKEVLELHYKYGKFSFNAWDKIYRKEILKKHEFPVGLCHEDQYFNTHVLPQCLRIVSISNALYRYRLRDSSITGNPFLGKDVDRITVKYDAFLFCKNNGFEALLPDVSRQYWRCFWKYVRRAVKLNILTTSQEIQIISYCKCLWKEKYFSRNPLILIASLFFIFRKSRNIFYFICRIL